MNVDKQTDRQTYFDYGGGGGGFAPICDLAADLFIETIHGGGL